MSERLDWAQDGCTWPNRDRSRFVTVGRLSWHVQVGGQGPALLLVHGTGATTHSWRGLLPRLSRSFTVVAPDLPGHGFTAAPPSRRLSLTWMAEALAQLLDALEVRPEIVVGHSAGVAILARLSLDRRLSPRVLVSLNGALLPFHGVQGYLFSPAAKLLAITAIAPRFFAWRARDPRFVDQLMKGTGSRIDPEGAETYARLARDPAHVAGALGMMANWDLRPLEHQLPDLKTPVVLVSSSRDRMITPGQALRVRRQLPEATVIRLQNLGHLAHEEDPEAAERIILQAAREQGGLLPFGVEAET